ncbi:MAG: APC family permease [Terriglobia bacterium]
MATLARRLRSLDYFTLAFGTMVGVGWLVVMDDWLRRGGPFGAMLGFVIGGAALLPIGYVYGRIIAVIPDAASEIAYTAKSFSPGVSFATGWMMTLAYFVVCPWETVAVGKIVAYIIPGLNSIPLYRIGANTVYLPQLVLGLALTALITAINYAGIRPVANIQNGLTFGLLATFAIFLIAGATRGSPRNLRPGFSHGGWISVLLVVQIVPYFMTGFESVAKCVEEAATGFEARRLFTIIFTAIVVGATFYVLVIGVVGFVYPWKGLVDSSFATAVAFERAFGARWIVDLILAGALVSLLKVLNGNFVAASRLVFSMGRRRLIDERAGRVHSSRQTPYVAVLLVGFLTAGCMLLGESILIPITEVGSMAAAAGWLATCASYLRMRPAWGARSIAILGIMVSALLILMKLAPFVPGHFTHREYLALGLWMLAGVAVSWPTRSEAWAIRAKG